MDRERTARLSVTIRRWLLGRLETYCERAGLSKSAVVTMALIEFLGARGGDGGRCDDAG